MRVHEDGAVVRQRKRGVHCRARSDVENAGLGHRVVGAGRVVEQPGHQHDVGGLERFLRGVTRGSAMHRAALFKEGALEAKTVLAFDQQCVETSRGNRVGDVHEHIAPNFLRQLEQSELCEACTP